MPLDDFQRHIARIIAKNRTVDSVVAVGSALNQHGVRHSNDIDLFHSTSADVQTAAHLDAAALADAGYDIVFERRGEGMQEAIVAREGVGHTRLQWVQAGSYHYFRPIADPEFGLRLSFIDLATNKTLAAASRREPRDYVDLRFILTTGVPLWQLINGAAGKDASITLLGILDAIRRHSSFTRRELEQAGFLAEPVDPATGIGRLRQLLEGAEMPINALPGSALCGVVLEVGSQRLLKEPPNPHDDFQLIEPVEGPSWPQGRELDAYLIARIIRNFGSRGERFWQTDEAETIPGSLRLDRVNDEIRRYVEQATWIGPADEKGLLAIRWAGEGDDEEARREALLALRPQVSQALLREEWRRRDPMMLDEWESRSRSPFPNIRTPKRTIEGPSR